MDPAELQWKQIRSESKIQKVFLMLTTHLNQMEELKFIGGDIAEGLIKISALKMKMKLLMLLQSIHIPRKRSRSIQ